MLTGAEEYSNKDLPPNGGRVGLAVHGEAQSNARQVRVLLAGGNRLLQESVVHLLEDSRFAVGDCAADIDEAIRLTKEQPGAFDLIIVQLIGFSDVGFFDRLAQLKGLAGHRRIVLLAWPEKDISFLAGSLEAGADAYLESSLSQEGLRHSLERVIAGKRIFPERLSRASHRGRDGARKAVATPPTGIELSKREIEILRHLAHGEPNKVIANALHIAEATVKVHVKGILRKTGARNRTTAAIWAIQNGLTGVFPLSRS